MKYLFILLVVFFFSCKGTKSAESKSTIETITSMPSEQPVQVSRPEFILDQIEIELQANVKAQRIEDGFFSSYGLKFLCLIENKKNIAVFKFDTSKVSRSAIIDIMSSEVGVNYVTTTLGCTNKNTEF